MSFRERSLYPNLGMYVLNQTLLPLKLIVPQPLVGKVPLLTTNKDIRFGLVLKETKGRLLDIGCGENELVSAYRLHGGQGLGVDVHPWPGVDLILKDSANLPFKNDTFETVTFVACINHIPNRDMVLHEAHRVLSDTGRLLITNLSPFISRIWHFIAFWDKDQHERGMQEGEVWGLTISDLEALLSAARFQVQEMVKFSWGLNQLLICSKR